MVILTLGEGLGGHKTSKTLVFWSHLPQGVPPWIGYPPVSGASEANAIPRIRTVLPDQIIFLRPT